MVAAYGLAAGTGTGADGNADLAVVKPIAQAMQQVIRAMVVAAYEDSAVARTLDATVDMIAKGVVGPGGKSKIDRRKKKP